MGIDDLVDRRTRGLQSPGEKFEEEFLARRAQSQWPVYLDQTAIEIEDGILQGDTEVDKTNFGSELGPKYRLGMEAATGGAADLGTILDETVSDRDLGTIIYQLNRLKFEIERDDSSLENVQEAIEAVFEKLLTTETGYDLSTHAHSGTGTIADVVLEMFADERVARQAKSLVDAFEASLSGGLLAKLDEPQMMTPLWEHQFEALRAWKEARYRGYADMATATGKTVLGIAAIALRYGHLHPVDELEGSKESSRRDHVLVVAHSDLIIEQWRREFDRHLNIPRERTGSDDDIELTWGNVHFRTPQSLIQREGYQYDLVILDEAHHYANGREWGKLLDDFDCDILALSGSVDDAGTDSEALQRRLREKVGPEIVRYTITEAQSDGVIPAFDWEVRYAPYAVDDDFVAVTEDIEEMYPEFRRAVERGDVDTDRSLRTYDEIRNFAHTSEGKEYKRDDELFKDLTTALFSRRTRRWNLSPVLESVVEVVDEHTNDHVVVLADSNAQVRELSGMIGDRYPDVDTFPVSRNQDRSELRDALDEFDASEQGGVLIGTGDLLGEGVDIPNARVAINMATGGVNPELVQRIGRVLRNPSGDKHAQFYNLVGIPEGDAAVPHEDGRRLLLDAAQFCVLGAKFDNLPGFATSTQLNDEALGSLLQEGDRAIEDLTTFGDDLDTQRGREFLAELRERVPESGACSGSDVLARWGEYSWLETAGVADCESDRERAVDDTRSREDGVDAESKKDDTPSRVELTQALQRLDNETRTLLTPEVVGERGEFDSATYEEVFGSVEDAIRAAGIASLSDESDEQREVIECLQEVAVAEGREPKPPDLPHRGVTVTDVYRAFDSWNDATVAAEVNGGPSEELVTAVTSRAGEESDDTLGDSEERELVPSELTELYEAFMELRRILTSLLESDAVDEAIGDGSPLATWHATIERWTVGDGPAGAPSYREQQNERTSVNITDYRETYGNGDKVTVFSEIETAPLARTERRLLSEVGLLEDTNRLNLPVAPESGERLPIAVVNDRDLGGAILLLSEFPECPQITQIGREEDSERREESNEKDGVRETKDDGLFGKLKRAVGSDAKSERTNSRETASPPDDHSDPFLHQLRNARDRGRGESE